MSAASVHVGDVATLLSKELLAASQEAISAKPKFTVAISGGSLPRFLSAAVSPNRAAFQLEKWDCYLADERLVPIDNIDANYREIQTYLPQLDLVPIDPTLNVEACAKDYERKVKAGVEGEIFDLVLLGLGPDGHTCSLFPGHELLNETEKVVAPITDSPKPPSSRVTLTLPVLNKAKKVMFVCTGAGKAPVVKDILENPDSKYPGALVKAGGELHWFLDTAAAADLSKEQSLQ